MLDVTSAGNNNNVSFTAENKTKVQAKLATLNSSSSIWDNYKSYDANNNGTLADDNLSDSTLLSLGQSMGIISDGSINPTEQGDIGDCWLLSNVNSIAETENGQEVIKNAIDNQHAGTEDDPYKVYIHNANGERIGIEITNEDLKACEEEDSKYSKGDIDMNLMELAVEKYYKSEIEAGRLNRDINNPLESNIPVGVYSMGYMLTGKSGQCITTGEIQPESAQYCQQLTRDNLNETMANYAQNQDNTSMTCCFKKQGFFKQLFSSKAKTIIPDHEYSITGVERDSAGNITKVLYKNPWDSNVTNSMSYSSFCKNVTQVAWLNLDE